jgi:hypothetical protein
MRLTLAALGGLLALASASSQGPGPHFVDMALELGLTRRHTGGGPEKGYIAEAKGGGAALLDFDGDGDLDIYWVNGATLEAPDQGAGNVLYRNEGARGFADLTASFGVEGRGWGMGALSADYDNDGDADLYLTALGEDLLYRNDGADGFADATARAGLSSPEWSTGAAFADHDLDGDLDLYVAQYARFRPDQIPRLGSQWKGVKVFVGPRGLEPLPDLLYRNEGDGTFADISRESGISLVEPGYGFGVLFADCDADGDPDLYVANDSSPNHLFRNEGQGRFSEVGLEANAAYGEMGQAQASMGVAWGDVDNDGRPEIFVTNFEDDYNTLYHNEGRGLFSDISFAAGLGRPSLPFVGFGAGFLDFDHDGDLDLLVANGHVYPQIDRSGSGTTYAQPGHLYENRGDGRFDLLPPRPGDGLGIPRVSRGSCIGDLDNDGDLDIFVANLNDRPSLLVNQRGNQQHWLGIKLAGRGSNRDGIGARLKLWAGGRRQVREVLCGSSFLCSEDPRAHFGLGKTGRVDSLEVHWPGGGVQRLADLPVNCYLLIEEGNPAWRLASPRP